MRKSDWGKKGEPKQSPIQGRVILCVLHEVDVQIFPELFEQGEAAARFSVIQEGGWGAEDSFSEINLSF